MAVSGLVLTLAPDSRLRDAAMHALRSDARIHIGELAGHRLPVVVDALTEDEDRELWQRLHDTPGVMHVDVVCVHDEREPHHTAPAANGSEGDP